MIKNFFTTDDIVTEVLDGGITRRVGAYHDNLMIVEVSFEEGSIGVLHSHPHEQITYVLEGEFEFVVNNELHENRVVKAGESLYKQPNIEHGAVCLKKGKLLDIFTPMREDFIG